MGPMKGTNDPRETDPWFFGMVIEDEENGPSNEEFFEASQQISRFLKDSCRIVCFSEDVPDLYPERGDPDRYCRDDLGFQGYEHDRMWAQYAANNTGVCIFFERQKLEQRMEEHFRGRPGRLLYGSVNYTSIYDPRDSPFHELSWEQIRHLGIEKFTKQHRETFARQLYLTKNPDWANEQEYRYVWIEGDEDHEDDAEFISIDGCITAVCLGAHFPECYLNEIKAIKNQLGIDFYQIKYINGKLSIVPAFIDPPPLKEEFSPSLALDQTFGKQGIATTKIGDSSEAHCMLVQPDGKIVVSGGYSTLRKNGTLRKEGFALARYNPWGERDMEFGEAGIAVTSIGAFHNGVRAIALQPDGKLVAAGTSQVDCNVEEITIARYDSTGKLDKSFGGNGIVMSSIKSKTEVHAIALQPDGKIILGGTVRTRLGSENKCSFMFTMLRYTEDGEADQQFGDKGITATKFAGGNDAIRSVVVQLDGKLIAAGSFETGQGWGFALARFSQDGSLDKTFGQNGRAVINWGPGGENWATTVILQPNNQVVAAGRVHDDKGYVFALARYNHNGMLDNTFGQDGTVKTPVGSTGMAYANSLICQSDGKLVCGGYADGHFALVRYKPDGSLDSTFGKDGQGITNLSGGSGIQSLAQEPGGKLIVAGTANGGTESIFAVAKIDQN